MSSGRPTAPDTWLNPNSSFCYFGGDPQTPLGPRPPRLLSQCLWGVTPLPSHLPFVPVYLHLNSINHGGRGRDNLRYFFDVGEIVPCRTGPVSPRLVHPLYRVLTVVESKELEQSQKKESDRNN